MKMTKNNIKYLAYILILLLSVLVFKFTLGSTFLFSVDGWNSVERQINSNNVIAKAFGSEPVWTVLIRGEKFNHADFSSDIVLDYGDSKWSGILTKTWQEDYSKTFQFRGDVYLIKNESVSEDVRKNMIIYFEKKTCYADSGDVYEWSSEINFNSEKIYKGCAQNFVVQGDK